MKTEYSWKNFGVSLLQAAAYLAAYRMIQWVFAVMGGLLWRLMGMWGWIIPISVFSRCTTLVAYAASLGVLWLWMRIRQRRVCEEVGIRPLAVTPMFAALMGGIGANIAVVCAFELIPFPEAWLTQYESASAQAFADYSWLTVVCTVLVAPIMEEVLFRGLLYTRLRRGMPKWIAAVLSALMFAAAHGNLLWGIYAFVVGLLFVWIFETTSSLKATILCHMGFNAVGQFSLAAFDPTMRAVTYIVGILLLGMAMFVLWLNKKASNT